MKTYTVWYLDYTSQPGFTRIAKIFISAVPTYDLATRIASNLIDDMAEVVAEAWVEED